ncbi:MAG TPA: hypothetical protein VF867_16085 [Arthrobacter sp.]
MGDILTENHPPVPPAPKQPEPAAAAPPLPAYAQQPGPYGQWVPEPVQAAPSGYRVAAGIIAIVLGCWLFMQFGVGTARGLGFLAFLSLVAAGGNLASGIVLLAKQRGRLRGAPVTALCFAGFALLLGLVHAAVAGGPVISLFSFLLAVPLLIVLGIGLSRERRGL